MVRPHARLSTPVDLTGRVCVLTGATRGIGRAAAAALARLRATVVLLGRFHARTLEVAEAIRAETGNADVHAYPCDLASLESIRHGADLVRRDFPAIHVLLNNAGTASPRRRLTADGFEQTLGVNHLGPFLLTNLLLDRLQAGAPSRVIVVASESHQATRLDFEDLQNELVYFGLRAYAQSKLANVYFANELARRTRGTGIVVNAVHPGLIATDLLADYVPLPWLVRPIVRLFGRTEAQGADSLVWLASAPDAGFLTGQYVIDRKPRRSSLIAMDAVIARRLWDVSARLTGLDEAVVPTPERVGHL